MTESDDLTINFYDPNRHSFVVKDSYGPVNPIEMRKATNTPWPNYAQEQLPEGNKANDLQVGGDHYKNQAVQPWDYVHRNNIGYLAGCVVKYISRYKQKNGVEDLKKAQHFLTKLIEEEQQVVHKAS